jgi:ferritin-like metal-binding protein YciE
MGHTAVATLLKSNLEEEKVADKKLSSIALKKVNAKA